MPFAENNILEDLLSLVLSQFRKYLPSGILKLKKLGIIQSLKFSILVEKILPISSKLNFTPNSWGCYRLSCIVYKISVSWVTNSYNQFRRRWSRLRFAKSFGRFVTEKVRWERFKETSRQGGEFTYLVILRNAHPRNSPWYSTRNSQRKRKRSLLLPRRLPPPRNPPRCCFPSTFAEGGELKRAAQSLSKGAVAAVGAASCRGSAPSPVHPSMNLLAGTCSLRRLRSSRLE